MERQAGTAQAAQELSVFGLKSTKVESLVEVNAELAPDHFFEELRRSRICQQVVIEKNELLTPTLQEQVEICHLSNVSLLPRNNAESTPAGTSTRQEPDCSVAESRIERVVWRLILNVRT
jgi:hypothetical protein